MKQNNRGQLIYTEADVCDLLMQGHDPQQFNGMILDATVDVSAWPTDLFDNLPKFEQESSDTESVEEFHRSQQSHWHMPQEYKELDIAQHVLDLCTTPEQLQRCGQELLLYQERDLFDLLRYLKYLVDVMTKNHIIWGVGRGSSVASYVLYLLGVHRIDSMFYDLDAQEFLR